jgi:hypothetical protein
MDTAIQSSHRSGHKEANGSVNGVHSPIFVSGAHKAERPGFINSSTPIRVLDTSNKGAALLGSTEQGSAHRLRAARRAHLRFWKT